MTSCLIYKTVSQLHHSTFRLTSNKMVVKVDPVCSRKSNKMLKKQKRFRINQPKKQTKLSNKWKWLGKKLGPKLNQLINIVKKSNTIQSRTQNKMWAPQRRQQVQRQAVDMRNQRITKKLRIKLICQAQLTTPILWSKNQITVNPQRLMFNSLPQMSRNQGKEQWLRSILAKHHLVRWIWHLEAHREIINPP